MANRLESLQLFLKNSPNDPFILFALAKEYEKLGDTPKALSAYLGLKTAHPSYVGLFYHLGKLYEKLEQPENALKIYEEGMGAARAAGDQHALSELAGAKFEIED